ncbi:hypothetical protein PoB_005974600 [Plakobranchus ocellatus]|uniref:Uncharacterized protein n=1 Tax=Plakobranchus ocellatus TaxID=259542 RepID=A0AAV4CMS4_9GAST|nr:hypothetical protein PoB_005974600 [Plakobranchus ocellatus]
MKEFSDSEEVRQTMLISQPPEHAMPESIAPKGLDLKRQWYLYDEIREFVLGEENLKDLVAPMPASPRPTAQSRIEAQGVRDVSKGEGSGQGKGKSKKGKHSVEEKEEAEVRGSETSPAKKVSKTSVKGKGRGRGRGKLEMSIVLICKYL